MAKQKRSDFSQEFDKDYIFNLIMPSESGPARLTPDPVPESLTPELSQDPADSPERDNLQILKEKLFGRQEGVQFTPGRELVLVNLMETLVVARLDTAFDKFSSCKCDKCKKDVATLALNSLPPHYVLCDPDNIQEKLDECPTKQVTDALIKAILYVKAHPEH